jgi:hypothetical protein
MATSLGLSKADELRELFGIKEIDDPFKEIGDRVAEAFAKIQGRANNFGINTYQEEFGSATVGQLGAYTDMMLYSTTSEGTTAKLQDGFNKILARANDT